MTTSRRSAVLRHLIAFDRPIEELIEDVPRLAWDCDALLVRLTRAHVEQVLRRHVAGELSAAEVESWANLIECREDIEFAPDTADVIDGLIYELANPLITRPLTIARAEQLLSIGPDL